MAVGNHIIQTLWVFSIILESVCVLPQLLLLRQTTVPTVIDSFYLLTLGSYRAFYILNWFVRGFGKEHHWDPFAMTFGIIQTALYVDFAWVYWSRQRIKLRHGGVVDSDDLQKGWLVNKILGSHRSSGSLDDEEEIIPHADGNRWKPATRWGSRGISVSGDDMLDERSRPSHKASARTGNRDGRQDEVQGILKSDDTVSEDEDLQPHVGTGAGGAVHGLSGGEEWRDDSRQTR